jgi:hypothetical protein
MGAIALYRMKPEDKKQVAKALLAAASSLEAAPLKTLKTADFGMKVVNSSYYPLFDGHHRLVAYRTEGLPAPTYRFNPGQNIGGPYGAPVYRRKRSGRKP